MIGAAAAASGPPDAMPACQRDPGCGGWINPEVHPVTRFPHPQTHTFEPVLAVRLLRDVDESIHTSIPMALEMLHANSERWIH